MVKTGIRQVNIPPAATNQDQSNPLQANPAVPIVTESTSTADVANNDSFVIPAGVNVL